MNEPSHGLARLFVHVGALLAQPVNPAMHVGIVPFVRFHERRDHLPRTLRRGGVVEIDQRLVAVDHRRQDGEIRAEHLRIEGQSVSMAATRRFPPAASAGPRRIGDRSGPAGVACADADADPTGECTAACTTRQDSRQHFWRLGVSRAPNKANMSWAVNCLRSSTVMPSIFSISIDAEAWLMQQPSPSNQADSDAILIVDLQLHVNHVPAQRIVIFVGVRGLFAVSPMIRILVMVEDMILVHFLFVVEWHGRASQ